MGEEIKKPKVKISRPLANSRIRTMAKLSIESSAILFGIDLETMDPEELRSKQSQAFDILKEDFERDYEIIDPEEDQQHAWY